MSFVHVVFGRVVKRNQRSRKPGSAAADYWEPLRDANIAFKWCMAGTKGEDR